MVRGMNKGRIAKFRAYSVSGPRRARRGWFRGERLERPAGIVRAREGLISLPVLHGFDTIVYVCIAK